MKVLFVIPGESTSPLMMFVKRQVDSLEKTGVIVRRFFLSSRTSPVAVFCEALRLRREILSFKPDILHAQYGTMTAFVSAVCALVTKRKLVVTFRGSDLNPSVGVSWIRSVSGKILSQVSALRASQVICVSKQLKGRLWFKKKRAIVMTDGTDFSLFYEIPKNQARAHLGVPADGKYILFNAGSFPKVKRLDIAQEVTKIIKSEIDNVELLVLKGLVKHEEVPFYINASDCLLVTSDWEGSPTIVKEALACNLPIISVDVGDVRERLLGVSPSVIVASNTPSMIAAKSIEVLKSPKRSNGREKLKDLSEENIAKVIREIYERLIKRGSSYE